MYNIHKVKKNTVDLEDQKKTINKRKAYIERYYSSVRPSLIDNYNKRINSFIRKVYQF